MCRPQARQNQEGCRDSVYDQLCLTEIIARTPGKSYLQIQQSVVQGNFIK